MLIKKITSRLYRNDEPGDEGSGEAVGSGNDARVAMLNSISDQNDEVRSEELADVNDDGTTSEFQMDREEKPAVEEPHDDPIAEEHPAAPEKHKLKVNGREIELTLDEIIARAQKVESADTYILEAARIKKEAEALLPHKPDEHTEPRRSEAMTAEKRRALVRAIQMGTEDEADAALGEILQANQPGVNPGDMQRIVDERLTFNESINRFKTEYKDIWDDPILQGLAQSTDQKLVAQGDRRPYWDRFQTIGDELRAWKASLAPKAEAAPEKAADKSPADRQQRKAASQGVPKSANARAPVQANDDDAEENVSEVIANIAKARGGPQWMRA